MGLLEWLGFREQWSLSSFRWLGHLLGAFLFCLAFVVFCASIAIFIHFFLALLTRGPYADDKAGEGIRNIGLVLAALFGAPFLVWRSIVLAQQAQTAAEALFNDKINAAVQELSARREVTRVVEQNGAEEVLRVWEDDLVSRVVAIDRLEGLVAEREDAAPRIVRLLAAYIRGNFQCNDLKPTEGLKIRKVPRMDLQKAVDCIGRILKTAAEVDDGHWRLDLTGCDFDGVIFATGYFRAVNFSKSRFEGSVLDEGMFEGCYFVGTLLNYGSFLSANLKGARFDYAVVNRPEPVPGGFVESLNMGDISGATFIGADISAIDYLGEADQIAKTFGTKDTKLSDNMRERKLPDVQFNKAIVMRRRVGKIDLTEEQQQLVDELEKSGFQNWSPHNSSDGITGHLVSKFFDELGMTSWPHKR
ncbi:pentapeptide repeat-containing protein [Hyphomonas jannaschiana VP2]|uniref:Pentapeptide repeat-containing protein n=2 Tax=Hyphomonas jannaschiana TaxID=86 RepID=A0A059FEN0_9PROT|nr:pentapeptide repeat-containing protein [Hyphomonas jannaschiana VP2]